MPAIVYGRRGVLPLLNVLGGSAFFYGRERAVWLRTYVCSHETGTKIRAWTVLLGGLSFDTRLFFGCLLVC